MMEIKVIEVCRTWRSVGIAPRLLEMMLRHPQIEDKIIYMVGYSWTWDLAGTHLTAGQYREKLFDLFQPHGFQEYETNEPNVSLKPENMLMCRIGKNITQVVKDRFKWLRFGLSPWTWEVDKSTNGFRPSPRRSGLGLRLWLRPHKPSAQAGVGCH